MCVSSGSQRFQWSIRGETDCVTGESIRCYFVASLIAVFMSTKHTREPGALDSGLDASMSREIIQCARPLEMSSFDSSFAVSMIISTRCCSFLCKSGMLTLSVTR